MPTARRKVNLLSSQVAGPALAFLRELLDGLRASESLAMQPLRFSLLGFAPAVRAEINEMLGEGEVSVRPPTICGPRKPPSPALRVRGEGIDDVEASAFPPALPTGVRAAMPAAAWLHRRPA